MKRTIAILLALAMCVCLFAACGGSADSAGAASAADAPAESLSPAVAGAQQPALPQEGGSAVEEAAPEAAPLDRSVYRELNVGSTDAFSTGHFDISAKLNSTYNCYAGFLVYDPVMYIDPVTKEYVSDILTDFYWDDELPGVVLTLRDDVYFADGDQMTAEDIKYTFQRQTAVARQADQFQVELINEAEISDDGLTLKIPFTQQYGPWRVYFGGNSGIMNKSWVEEHGGDDCDFYDPAMICGSGPYKVTDFKLDAYAVYEKRDDWWMKDEAPDGYATYDKITVWYYTDATTMMVDYETGKLDVALGITESDYSRVENDPSLGQVSAMPAQEVCVLQLNVQDGSPLQDENLRKAVCLGTDTDTLALLGYGALQSHATSTTSVWNAAHIDGCDYEYDPDQARQIIKDNGLEGTTLKWIANPGPTLDIATAFQENMRDIGIEVEIETYDIATCVVMWMTPNATDLQCDGNSFGNTANEAHNQYSMMGDGIWPTLTKPGYRVAELVDNARYSTDDAQRIEYYKELQQYLYDNYLCIPICEWAFALCFNSEKVASCTPTETTCANLRFIMPVE